jgi:hypothetical protein
MDIITICYFVLIGLLCIFLGRFMDKYWRAKIMRAVLKRNYAILKIKSKEGNRVIKHIINLDKDMIKVGNEMWAIKENHIYVESDAEGKKAPERGTIVKSENTHWDEGLPVVTVDRDSIKTIGYYKDTEAGSVKPEEVGATFGAWVANEIAKGMKEIANLNVILMVACILSLGSFVINYLVMGEIGILKPMIIDTNDDVNMLMSLHYDEFVAKGIIKPEVNITISG